MGFSCQEQNLFLSIYSLVAILCSVMSALRGPPCTIKLCMFAGTANGDSDIRNMFCRSFVKGGYQILGDGFFCERQLFGLLLINLLSEPTFKQHQRLPQLFATSGRETRTH